jgi:hypothetical protein
LTFIHEDPEFDDLLNIVAAERGLAVSLVEKDYWVTHALWSLQNSGFEVWFKGGTSLSKGFGLIKRFSEDLDLRVDPGTAGHMKVPENWKSTGKNAIRTRKEYLEGIVVLIRIEGAEVSIEEDPTSDYWRGIKLRAAYPGKHLAELGPMKQFVLLEIGSARVVPSVRRDLTSFTHEYLNAQGRLGDYIDNQPKAIRCLHPLVTLVEKLEAIQRRFERGDEPAAFIRHYEDAAAIIASAEDLPPLDGYATNRDLVQNMLKTMDIRTDLSASALAYNPADSQRWDDMRAAHASIESMFWGPRIDLDLACTSIRGWIERSQVG